MWDVGDVLDARELWFAAAAVLDSTRHRSTLAYVLAGTAVTMVGQPEHHGWADELLAKAVSIARSEPPAALAEVLNMRGEFARATGDDLTARRSYEEGLEVVSAIDGVSFESILLANLSYIECHAGRYEEARRMSRTALRVSWTMGRRLMAAWTVGELAISARGLGELDLAARLVGAAAKAMETLKAGRYPADVAEDERLVASLLDELGRDELDRLVAEGRRLSLDEAVTLALGE